MDEVSEFLEGLVSHPRYDTPRRPGRNEQDE